MLYEVITKDNLSASSRNLGDFTKVNDLTIKHWSSVYNVEIEPMPEKYILTGKSFSYTTPEISGIPEADETAAGNSEIDIPENYKAINGTALMVNANENGYGGNVMIGEATKHYYAKTSDRNPLSVNFTRNNFV